MSATDVYPKIDSTAPAYFEALGFKCQVERRPLGPRERPHKPRIYVFTGDASGAAAGEVPAPDERDFPHLALPSWRDEETGEVTRSVHTKRGDFPELDKAWDRANRSWINAAKQYAIAGLSAAGLDPNSTLRFSKKAGCSCGCSPGFILSDFPAGFWELFVTCGDAKDFNGGDVSETWDA